MKRARFLIWVLVTASIFSVTLPVSCQTSTYTVRLNRDFGYGAGSNIRGTFSIHLVGEEDRVDSVTFLIDGKILAIVDEVPFSFQFHTDDYGFGVHNLSAEVMLKDGNIQTTQAVAYQFISPQEERKGLTTILAGVGGAVALALLVYLFVQGWLTRGKPKERALPGAPRQYGLLGGTICPKCGRPFPRHVWGMNLVVGRLDRCENCGRWVMTARATPAELQAAEWIEQEMLQQDANSVMDAPSEPKDDLEETKYIDHI